MPVESNAAPAVVPVPVPDAKREPQSSAPPARSAVRRPGATPEQQREMRKHPLVRKALELSGGSIVDVTERSSADPGRDDDEEAVAESGGAED